jgi:c-di-GMP-binding flagellar brake protein YcgR
MAREPAEIIQGGKIRDLVVDQIKSRRLGKLTLPHTSHEWMTILLEIVKAEEGELLLIDGISTFEAAFSSSRAVEVVFEFLQTDGIPCQFRTPVVRFSRQEIWVELPKEIIRNQRRAYFRIEASEGAEVHFSTPQGNEIKAELVDYSMGGVSFCVEEKLPLAVGDTLEKLTLHLPQGKEWISVHIARGVVIRWDRGSWGRKPLWAFEIFEISDLMREKLRQNIFINQRDVIRKVKRIPTLKSPVGKPS